MNKSENEFSRVTQKNKQNRSNRLLNSSIAIVVLLIIVTIVFIFSGDDGEQKADKNSAEEKQEQKDALSDEEKVVVKNEKDTESTNETLDTPDTPDEPGTLTHIPSDDKVVVETIVNAAWEPITTNQTGKHVSSYDGKSVDWNEKKEAIAYATGSAVDSLIFWKINNGGSPTKSIGIVSTHDKSEKYRVYIEWVEQEGWKPVQVDVLNTLEL